MAQPSDSTSDTMQQQLQELMQYDADVQLKFDDGDLPGKSYLLGLHSSVLQGAVEAGTAAAVSNEDSRMATIPMPDIAKQDWMQVAAFLYPVVPPPVISSWSQLEVLLKVASRFDLKQLLHRADAYITAHAGKLVADPKSELCVWKWLRLADKAGLQQCLPVLVDKVVAIDRAACKGLANLQGLSLSVVQLLVVSCASNSALPELGSRRTATCHECQSAPFNQQPYAFGQHGGFGQTQPATVQQTSQTVCWVCDKCCRKA